MFIKALARTPTNTEQRRIVGYLTTVLSERETLPQLLLYDAGVWQDVAHSLFNLKEYLFIQ